MKCTEPMRHLGPVDIGPITEALARLPEEAWSADMTFQKRVAPYRKTRTIYLLMTSGGVYAPTSCLTGWDLLRESFEPLVKQIAGFFPKPGRVMNAQLALLGPGDDIAEHVDYGPVLELSHRVHVPLETHPEVSFIVEGKPIALQVGQAYELDNMRLHSVYNGSPLRRIHVIVDYYEDPLITSVIA